jgi:hypothetical protein
MSMYSITENIYYSHLYSVAILLQPERNCCTSYNTRKVLGSHSLCAIVLRSSPPSHVSTSNGQRSSQLFCVHYTAYGVTSQQRITPAQSASTKKFTGSTGREIINNNCTLPMFLLQSVEPAHAARQTTARQVTVKVQLGDQELATARNA